MKPYNSSSPSLTILQGIFYQYGLLCRVIIWLVCGTESTGAIGELGGELGGKRGYADCCILHHDDVFWRPTSRDVGDYRLLKERPVPGESDEKRRFLRDVLARRFVPCWHWR